MDDDKNKRQLASMVSQIDTYEKGEIDLSWLISSLESLLGALDDVSQGWRQKFRKEWGVLEEVYSVAIVREKPLDTPENQKLINTAIENLRKLISQG